MRVAQFLTDHRIPFDTLLHPPAFTAQKRARFLHITGRRVAKCVLLRTPGGYCLAVLPATHRIDTEVVAVQVGGPVRLADEREIAQVFPDCEWGVVPPFGTLYGLPTILDEALDPESVLVFEANSHGEAIRLSCRDFERREHARRLTFARAAHA